MMLAATVVMFTTVGQIFLMRSTPALMTLRLGVGAWSCSRMDARSDVTLRRSSALSDGSFSTSTATLNYLLIGERVTRPDRGRYLAE